LEDNEVVGIRNKITGKYIYDGNLVLARRLGLKL